MDSHVIYNQSIQEKPGKGRSAQRGRVEGTGRTKKKKKRRRRRERKRSPPRPRRCG